MIPSPKWLLAIESGLAVIFCGFGYWFIFFIYHRLDPFLAGVIFGYPSEFPNAFQMYMWLPFFIGVFLLCSHYVEYRIGKRYFTCVRFSVDESTILTSPHFAQMLDSVRNFLSHPLALAPKILYQVILKYQSSKSVDQASTMLNSLSTLALHRLELKFNSLRYICWLIPTLGFMGTVYGISLTVSVIGQLKSDDPTLLSTVAKTLAVAFDTTLLGIVQSAILIFFSNIIELDEEKTINSIGEHILENVINRVG
jgi:biopolymer transport protein ExbB/TolQ